MKLTDRDINIINFIIENTGATIEQLQELFFPSYNMAAKRLKILSDNNYLNEAIHPTLGKKVYYNKKIPSYHTLVITEVLVALKDNVAYMKREYEIKKLFVDCIFILKNGNIITVEVDIFNRTKENKLITIYNELAKTNANITMLVVSKHERRQGMAEKRIGRINNIKIDEIKKVLSTCTKVPCIMK